MKRMGKRRSAKLDLAERFDLSPMLLTCRLYIPEERDFAMVAMNHCTLLHAEPAALRSVRANTVIRMCSKILCIIEI